MQEIDIGQFANSWGILGIKSLSKKQNSRNDCINVDSYVKKVLKRENRCKSLEQDCKTHEAFGFQLTA